MSLTFNFGRITMTNFLKGFAVSLMLMAACHEMSGTGKSPLPPQGVIPDEATAVKVAEVVFPPIFGSEEVAKYLPYHAQFKDGVWTIYGTLKRGSRGGTPQMTIQKKDGKVIEVWHSQ
jgi:hypothetical protein